MRDDQNDRPYVNRILQMIPSKLLREHLKKYLPELTLLQWASIGGIVMCPNTQAKFAGAPERTLVWFGKRRKGSLLTPI